MSDTPDEQTASTQASLLSPLGPTALLLLAVVCGSSYAVIAILSSRFEYTSASTARPIVLVLCLFAIAFAAYLAAIFVVSRIPSTRNVLAFIFVTSIAFRLILIPSTPIQEVDIYRYLWDGMVLNEGVNPYRYPPRRILEAPPDSHRNDDVSRLVAMRDGSATARTILERVHFAELPSVYPPVSQVVFALAARSTPDSTTVMQRIIVMKLWLMACDVATLVLIAQILRRTGRSPALSLIYGWCPLLMKEFANSGHLDAIAVLLTTLSVLFVVDTWQRTPTQPTFTEIGRSMLAATALALAIGAKLYPVVLLPLFAVAWQRRLGIRRCIIPLTGIAALTVVVLWPMLPKQSLHPTVVYDVGEPLRSAETSDADVSPSRGLQVFLRRWEMNDFLFLLLIENIKADDAVPDDQRAWFTITPSAPRKWVADVVSRHLEVDRWEAAFLVARLMSLVIFAAIVIALARRASRIATQDAWLEAAFLTLAWFWLLCPTQNPWYWTWVLPLLPLVRNRIWLAMSGLVLLYYLRFWFMYQYPEAGVWGTRYAGQAFFDLVVTWIEFAPWLFLLLVTWVIRRRNRTRSVGEDPPPNGNASPIDASTAN